MKEGEKRSHPTLLSSPYCAERVRGKQWNEDPLQFSLSISLSFLTSAVTIITSPWKVLIFPPPRVMKITIGPKVTLTTQPGPPE